MEDVEGREYVVLDAQIERTTDPKKSFAFKMNLRGLPEPLCFGTDDENVMNEWIKKLECASISKSKYLLKHRCGYSTGIIEIRVQYFL